MADLDDEDDPMWICGCGEFVDGDWHCPRCGSEPPWGCDCGQHGDPDEEEEYDLGDVPEELWP